MPALSPYGQSADTMGALDGISAVLLTFLSGLLVDCNISELRVPLTTSQRRRKKGPMLSRDFLCMNLFLTAEKNNPIMYAASFLRLTRVLSVTMFAT